MSIMFKEKWIMLVKYKTNVLLLYLIFFQVKMLLPDVCICKAMEMQPNLENAQDWLIPFLSSV